MPFSRSKDVVSLPLFFSSAAFSCSLRSKRVLPQRSGNASEKQEKMSFEAVCIGHMKVLQVFAQKNVWMGRQPLLGIAEAVSCISAN